MIKQFNKNAIYLLFLYTFLSVSCKKEKIEAINICKEKVALEILFQINMIDTEKLIKINKRGCIHNCLPWKETLIVMENKERLSNLGYDVEWNEIKKKYFLIENKFK